MYLSKQKDIKRNDEILTNMIEKESMSEELQENRKIKEVFFVYF